MFTVVRSVLLRQLPFRDPDHLIMLYEHFRLTPSMNVQGFNYNAAAPADYYDWRAQTHGFEDIAAWRHLAIQSDRRCTGNYRSWWRHAAGSWNLFLLLGVHPQ